MKWADLKPIINAEMDRQKVSKNQLALKIGLTASTVYKSLSADAGDIELGNLDRYLEGLGKSWAWLVKKADKGGEPCKPSKAKKSKSGTSSAS